MSFVDQAHFDYAGFLEQPSLEANMTILTSGNGDR